MLIKYINTSEKYFVLEPPKYVWQKSMDIKVHIKNLFLSCLKKKSDSNLPSTSLVIPITLTPLPPLYFHQIS